MGQFIIILISAFAGVTSLYEVLKIFLTVIKGEKLVIKVPLLISLILLIISLSFVYYDSEHSDGFIVLAVIIICIILILLVSEHNSFAWTPIFPMQNTSGKVKSISEYPTDIALNDIGDLDLSREYVYGLDAFKQSIRIFIQTKRHESLLLGDDFGIDEADTIFSEKRSKEFNRQCNSIAQHMLAFYSDWIVEIYGITRKGNWLIFELKVEGYPGTLKCEISQKPKGSHIEKKSKKKKALRKNNFPFIYKLMCILILIVFFITFKNSMYSFKTVITQEGKYVKKLGSEVTSRSSIINNYVFEKNEKDIEDHDLNNTINNNETAQTTEKQHDKSNNPGENTGDNSPEYFDEVEILVKDGHGNNMVNQSFRFYNENRGIRGIPYLHDFTTDSNGKVILSNSDLKNLHASINSKLYIYKRITGKNGEPVYEYTSYVIFNSTVVESVSDLYNNKELSKKD